MGLFVAPNNNSGIKPFVCTRLKQQRHVNHLNRNGCQFFTDSAGSIIDVLHHYCFASQPSEEDLSGQFDENREVRCFVQPFSGGFVLEDGARQQNAIDVAYHEEEQLPYGKHKIDGTIRQQDVCSKRFHHAFVTPTPLVETNAISSARESGTDVRVEQLVVRYGRSL